MKSADDPEHAERGSGGESPFPAIERTDVSDEKLKAFKSEEDFIGLGVDLMIEAGSYITIGASILSRDGTWSREQAAVGGNMVRLYKLFSAMLDQTVQHRRETSFILARLTFETIVTLHYLMQEFSPELIESYLKYSLQQEKELLSEMDANIAERSGIVRPIEDRMRKSIDRAFRSAGLTPGDLPAKRIQHWGGKNFREKAKAVGLEDAYLGMFANASQNVHGAWSDLYSHHLEVAPNGGFTPNLEWNRPRPQLLFSIALLGVGTVPRFGGFIGGDEVAQALLEPAQNLHERIVIADEAHEAYLAGKEWPAI